MPRRSDAEGWQLIIDTSTIVVTFLMVFIVQNSQNRDGKALQAKIDELILTSKAQNKFVGIEKLEEGEIGKVSQSLAEKAEQLAEIANETAVLDRGAQPLSSVRAGIRPANAQNQPALPEKSVIAQLTSARSIRMVPPNSSEGAPASWHRD